MCTRHAAAAAQHPSAYAAAPRCQALLNPTRMMSFLEEKIATLGTSACPPYHLALVVGGMSAEQTLKTVKYASARYYDNLPTRRAHARRRCAAPACPCLSCRPPDAFRIAAGAPAGAPSATWSWRRRCTS